MNKFDKLIKFAENFYRQAMLSYYMTKEAAESYVMPDDMANDSEEIPKDTTGILAAADNLSYDIVNETLLTQFETFINTYKALLEALSLKPADIQKTPDEAAKDTAEDAGELIDALNTRYERISSNPYLNYKIDDPRYEESFPPSKILGIVQAIVTDAENHLKDMVGDRDLNMEEVRAAQQAKEFNQVMFDRGDKNMTVTGDKVKQLNEANKRYFEKLIFIKKVGPSHPDWGVYDNHLKTKKAEFHKMKADPERYKAYRVEANKRQIKHREFDSRLEEVEFAYSKARDPDEKEKLRLLIDKIKNSKTKFEATRVNTTERIREKRESKTLEGLIIHLSQKLASLKKDTAKDAKTKLAKDPILNTYKNSINEAAQLVQQDPSPANKLVLEEAKRKEYDFAVNYLNNNSTVIQVLEDIPVLYKYRDDCKQVFDNGWTAGNTVDEQIKPFLFQMIVQGEKLFNNYSGRYKSVSSTLREIIEHFKSKVS